MSTEPLRRVLFPTPRKNDDGTSSRSIQRIRPKPELTPVNLESTPTTFKRLVENSPVPLAVAAAKAALRAANSAQNGRPIMTEMTRAAEEVVKNSNYNAVRPPHFSPRPLPSPAREQSAPVRPSSALLPPIPSPSTRPAGALSTFRRMFMRQQQARSWSSTPVPNDDILPAVGEIEAKEQQREEVKAPQSPVHVPRKRIPPFRQPSFIPSSSKKRIRKPLTEPGKQPHSRAKFDPLSRLFGSSSPHPVASTDESLTISDDDHIEEDKKEGSSSKTVESSEKQPGEKQPKKRPRSLARIEPEAVIPEAVIPEEELNESPAMRTRSAKRSRRASKTNVADDSGDTKPRKKRRMSEVLRLQKALESAAWTNSVAVEKQTEIIVISDCSPDRPRAEVPVKIENKTTHDKGKIDNPMATTARRKISGSTKELKRKKSGPSNEIRQRVITKKSNPRSKSLGKRSVKATKRRFASAKKPAKKNRAMQDKDRAVDASVQDVKQKMNRKEAREKKKNRLRRLEAVVAAEKHRARKKVAAGKTAEASVVAPLTDTGIPLKKRLSPEKKKDLSPAEAVTNISMLGVDAKYEKMPRKSRTPKRLGATVSHTNEHETVCEKSKETTNPETRSPHPEGTNREKARQEMTDSEATLSEAARPRGMQCNL